MKNWAAARADALIYGSLAQRSGFNRSSLSRLLTALPPRALRIFDVNLRKPHDDLTLVRRLAQGAAILKVNAEEAARVVGANYRPGDEKANARELSRQLGCSFIVVTAGARGAGALINRRWLWAPGRRVGIVDTVGSGDAFLAAFVAHLLSGDVSVGDCLARACRIGEWVASEAGATPSYAHAFRD
jgi:fructokinase